MRQRGKKKNKMRQQDLHKFFDQYYKFNHDNLVQKRPQTRVYNERELVKDRKTQAQKTYPQITTFRPGRFGSTASSFVTIVPSGNVKEPPSGKSLITANAFIG